MVKDKANTARWGWYLYDFANSILVINGSLYFPQWIVGRENSIGDLWYNLAFVMSSVFLVLTAPVLGLLSDKKKTPYRFLILSSMTLVLGGVGVGLSPYLDDHSLRVTIALGSFWVVLVSYQVSLVFYNTLLGNVSAADQRATVSGRALAWGWVGGIFAIILSLPYALNLYPPFTSIGGMGSILPSTLLTMVLLIVSLRMIGKESHKSSQVIFPDNQRTSFINEIRMLSKNSVAVLFLIGFFFFSDAILTLQNNSTIYMDKVIGFTDDEIAYQFILVLVTGAIGALASIRIINRLGLLKSLKVILLAWVIIVAITPLTTDAVLFTVSFALIGLLNGGIWNVARVLFYHIAPALRKGTYFGFYASFERFASILGPLIWSTPVSLMSSESALRYQVAFGSMALFLIIGVLFISRISNESITRTSLDCD